MSLTGGVLLLEDDALLGESIQDFLEEEGYDVLWCRNGQEALDASFTQRFDLYLLDINVPLINGLDLLGDLRHSDDETPAIFLTSHTEKSVMLDGFERGADDYMKKPLDLDELLVRMQALLRRRNARASLQVGELQLDEEHKTILYKQAPMELRAKEYALMALLIRHAGQVVTKDMIMDALWSASESVSDGALRVYVNRLNGQMGAKMIENIRGVGYRLVP